MDCISRKVLYLIISEYFWYFVLLNNAAIKILVYGSSHSYSERSRFLFFQNFFVGNSGKDFKFLNLYLNRCVIFISLNNMSTLSLSDLFTVSDIFLFLTMKMNI